MSQSQANESADSKEQATLSTMLQLKQTPPSTSKYPVLPERQGESDSPVNPYGEH